MVHKEIVGHLPKERNYFSGTDDIEIGVNMTSDGEYDFRWFPQEMVDCPSCQTVMVKTEDTSQVLTVEVMDQLSGCLDTFKVLLREFDDCISAENGIGVPNVFSPNEDGYNDFLNIEAPEFNDIKAIGIFDRWGQRVFYSSSIDESWDGRFNGELVQSGVYSYFIEAVCPDTNEALVKSGDITVLR
jgi:gliding motility-associated-like protein